MFWLFLRVRMRPAIPISPFGFIYDKIPNKKTNYSLTNFVLEKEMAISRSWKTRSLPFVFGCELNHLMYQSSHRPTANYNCHHIVIWNHWKFVILWRIAAWKFLFCVEILEKELHHWKFSFLSLIIIVICFVISIFR